MTESDRQTSPTSGVPQHVHILGIAGTFMGGIAAIATEMGFRVSGSDLNVYPPMSTQLEKLGIQLVQGYDAEQLDLNPDVVIVGNAMSRGKPVIEELLNRGIAYTSGPQWLAEHVLRHRHVLAVAGTHGKTTTASMLAWILDSAGMSPGFLIGGVPANFALTARLGKAPFFVIEADEYDTAFFDKRAKFVHYRPRTAVLNNLEYDHADIYPDVAAIRWQFHQLLRTVPHSGRVIVNREDKELAQTLSQGCWTPVETCGLREAGKAADMPAGVTISERWSARIADGSAGGQFEVWRGDSGVGAVQWSLLGQHNVLNALSAIAAAVHVGVSPPQAVQALSQFQGVKRRLEIRGVFDGATIYDDFAHHPTAIQTTLAGLRERVGAARIHAVLEPRSNTMKLGAHREQLADALRVADQTWVFQPPNLGWNLREQLSALRERVHFAESVDGLAQQLASLVQPGDHVVIMSNGGFGGLHEKLMQRLSQRKRP